MSAFSDGRAGWRLLASFDVFEFFDKRGSCPTLGRSKVKTMAGCTFRAKDLIVV
jgi:hypothetical protein